MPPMLNHSLKSSRPIVGLVTHETSFAERVKEAAERTGADFLSSIDANEALDSCRNRASACILVDYEIARSRIESRPTWRMTTDHVLLFAVPRGDVKAAFRAATAGALAVIEKEESVDTFSSCLLTAIQSDREIRGAKQTPARFKHAIFESLSERELQILGLLVDGEPNKCVASLLDIGLRTVEGDRAKVMKKLGVESFAALIQLVTTVENESISSSRTIFESVAKRPHHLRQHRRNVI